MGRLGERLFARPLIVSQLFFNLSPLLLQLNFSPILAAVKHHLFDTSPFANHRRLTVTETRPLLHAIKSSIAVAVILNSFRETPHHALIGKVGRPVEAVLFALIQLPSAKTAHFEKLMDQQTKRLSDCFCQERRSKILNPRLWPVS